MNAALAGRLYEVPGLVVRMKGKESALLSEVAEAMTVLLDNPRTLLLWERVREAARWRNPTPMEILAAFLLEAA